MAALLEEQRESWGTRGGFILAAVGSAVGLGNLWGFPYKLYSYGGGAFLIPYIIAMLIIGIPLMILEFSLGHYTQRAAPAAFRHGNKRFEIVGWWGIILGFVIITYYPVIMAYCFSFLWFSITGIFKGGELPWAAKGIEGVQKANDFFFQQYLGSQQDSSVWAIRLNIVVPLLVAWVAMYLCIFKGVRSVGKIVWLTVSLPWLMLLILVIRGLTLEGSMQGLAYFLDPNWSELAKPITWRYAFGQVFFSLSLAFGVMITYASFLHRRSDLNNNAAIVGLADFATSFVAGLAVFATLGGMAYATQQANSPVPIEKVAQGGPSLAFVAFPYALAQLPYSAWFSFVFFFALITLGIDSAFSITESVLASIVDKTGWRRNIVLPVMSLVGLCFGLIYTTKGGLNWLGTIDGFVNGTWGIALIGFLECVVIGWLWQIGILRRHANSRSDWKLGKWWDYLIRIVIPVVLGTLFFWQLFDDFGSESGFLRTPSGEWIVHNCVGMGVLLAAPILALVFSLIKGAEDNEAGRHEQKDFETKGAAAGALALVLALGSMSIYAGMRIARAPNSWQEPVLWTLPVAGIIAILISNSVLEKHHSPWTQPSRLARWAGIAGTVQISVFIATTLFRLTRHVKTQSVTTPRDHQLGGASYVILVVVLLIIIGGLGWCFYKALSAAGVTEQEQLPDVVGDEQEQQNRRLF